MFVVEKNNSIMFTLIDYRRETRDERERHETRDERRETRGMRRETKDDKTPTR
jgi:hypothetical protein